MKKNVILFSLLLFVLSANSQQKYRTQILQSSIKTLEIGVENEKFSLPIIELNSNNTLKIQFDEMSYDNHSYSYKVIHCNDDWTPSNLNSSEYLQGYSTGNITEYRPSSNTTFLYTHYSFSLPNNDMSFKISGNYAIIIFEDNASDNPIAIACFSIVEPKVSIKGTIRGNTDTELNGKYQQLDFDVSLNGISARDPNSEIKIVVRQNNRIDNEVRMISPTFINGSKLNYINNKKLIFEGGNEYNRFDISSVYAANQGVNKITFDNKHYTAWLNNNKIKVNAGYSFEFDVNGKFLINFQEYKDNVNTDADYMYVNFTLPTSQVFFDGMLYLGGEFNYNMINENSRLNYDAASNSYKKTILLKQGGYNYQYWFLPKGSTVATNQRVEGSYWQTINEYTIYVYHRPWGERYDKLVGVTVVLNK